MLIVIGTQTTDDSYNRFTGSVIIDEIEKPINA